MKKRDFAIGLIILLALLLALLWPRIHFLYLAITSRSDILTDLQRCVSNYGDLDVYREPNNRLTEDPERVVFIGDSMIAAWTGEPFNNPHFVNRGIGFQTTSRILVRFRQDAINLKPKLILMLAGINDIGEGISLDDVESNIASMSELARVHNIQMVLCSVLPINDSGRSSDNSFIKRTMITSPEKIRALNGWIKSYADANGIAYLDYYSEMVDTDGLLKPELSNDGLHPNAAGYSVMTQLLKRAGIGGLKPVT